MITWIQTYFQQHFRTIFAVLLGVIIISFVFGINASGGFGRPDRNVVERPFFGHNLNSEQEMSRIIKDGEMSAILQRAQIRYQEEMDNFAKVRVAGIAMADELHLPAPSDKEVSAYIATLPFFQNNGVFDAQAYTKFSDSLKNNPRFSIADANRVFRDDTRLAAFNRLVGGPGYVLPADVREVLSRSDSKWSITIASLNYATFEPNVNVTEEALKKFFEEHSGNFEVPSRAKLSVIEFKGAEFASPAPLDEVELRSYYNTNLSRFPAPADPANPAATAPAIGVDNFQKVRPQVEAALRNELSVKNALKAANDFTVALYNRKATANSAELTSFLVSQSRTAQPLPPYSAENPPATMPWLMYYNEQISQLGKDRYFSEPLPTPDGAIILLWNETLPAYQPAFAEAREKVVTQYKENEKKKSFMAQGQMLQAKLNAATKSGTAFEKAAADAQLEVKSFANFTLRDTPKDLPSATRQALLTLKAGEISEMISADNKGYIVYAAQKQLPDLTPSSPRFAEMRSQLMAYNSSTSGNAIMSNLVKAELDRTAPPAPPATPAAK